MIKNLYEMIKNLVILILFIFIFNVLSAQQQGFKKNNNDSIFYNELNFNIDTMSRLYQKNEKHFLYMIGVQNYLTDTLCFSISYVEDRDILNACSDQYYLKYKNRYCIFFIDDRIKTDVIQLLNLIKVSKNKIKKIARCFCNSRCRL